MGKSSEEATAKIKRHVFECCDEIERRGWTDVALGLETMGKASTWGTLEEIASICKDRKGVAPVIDFAHIHARNNGMLKTVKDFSAILSSYEKIYKKYLHSHFTCVKYGLKGEREHSTLVAKDPDFKLLAEAIRKKRYNITIISESPILEQDSLKMRAMLK
jgi:deoxyribonuclease-4